MALSALLFDLDGTLLDSNGAHIEAWRRAFEDVGFPFSADRIAPEIGKGGDQLVPALLGQKTDDARGEALRKACGQHFLEIAASQSLRPFPGAVELIQEAKKRGLKTALATSSDPKNLAAIEKSCGIEWSKLVDLTTTAKDAENSKPAPDIVAVCAQNLGISPAECALVGDTPHDARACRGAGVGFLGVQNGAWSEAELIGAGARLVRATTQDLWHEFDAILEKSAPGKTVWTQELLEKLMREALQSARDGMEAGEAPIGCVLARGTGKSEFQIVARGFNAMNATQNKTAHAEIVAFQKAAGKVPLDAADLVLASTLEPCVMCFGACAEAAVDLAVYALAAPFDAGTHRVLAPQSPESTMPRVVGPILELESRALFEEWLAQNRETPQAAFVKQLLGEKS